MENKVWLIAGTVEGRTLASFLASLGVTVLVSVATDYGAELFEESDLIRVVKGRMDLEDMKAFIQKEAPSLVLDASHPYAGVVTENAKRAAKECGTEYMRMVREGSGHEGCVEVRDFTEAVEFLSHTEGNIFLTTGSKNLIDFTHIENYADRIALRVLPLKDSLANALDLGYRPKNIICMQGPFPEDLNVAMFKMFGARYVVSKDSGKAGGFEEKLAAVKKVGARLVLITRGDDTGDKLDVVLKKLRERFGGNDAAR